MNRQAVDSPSARNSREVDLMESTHPSAPPRHWRIALPVSLGVVLLLASLVIAAVSLRSHAHDSASPSDATPAPADNQRWMSLGLVYVEGGLTKIYPLQQGRIKSIEAVENEPVEAVRLCFTWRTRCRP